MSLLDPSRPHGPVAIVIPVYREEPTADERISLARCAELYSHRPILLVAPEGMDVEASATLVGADRVLRWPASSFRSAATYSRLLLSRDFYEAFVEFEFILLHQTDVFLFEDHLERWCAAGYDYLGAPLITLHADVAARLLPEWPHPTHGTDLTRYAGCNGGLALRRIPAFLRILEHHATAADAWTEDEDFFWSFPAPVLDPDFRTPPLAEALRFAFHGDAEEAFRRNDRELPFGSHDWPVSRDFLAPHLSARGYPE